MLKKTEFQNLVIGFYDETGDVGASYEAAFEEANGTWGTEDEQVYGAYFDEIVDLLG